MSKVSSHAHPRSAASPDDIDIAAIGAAVKRHFAKLAVVSVVAGAVAFLATSVMTPRYMSQAQIEIISKGVGNPFERRDGGAPDNVTVRMDKEAIGTHVRGLQSTDLALKVARDLDLESNPEFNGALRPKNFVSRTFAFLGNNPRETDEDRVLKSYFKALRVYQVKETRGIVVEFTSTDPALSARAANGVIEAYRKALAERTVSESNDARRKLAPQIMKLAEEVAEAEAEVTRFRGKANIFEAGRDRTPLSEQQIAELSADLTRTSTARADAEARARQARDIAKRGEAETLPDVQKSQLVPRLVEQRVRIERQISELSATLLPGHPRMKQLYADLAGLNMQIDGEVEKIVQGLEREVKVVALREDGIRRRLDEAKRRFVDAGGDDVKLRALESIAKSKRAEYERLQAQLEAARTTSDANAVPGEVSVLSQARPATERASPRTVMIVSVSAVAAFLLGLSIVVLNAMFTGARSGTPAAAPFPRRDDQPITLALTARPSASKVRDSAAAVSRDLADMARGRSGFRTMVATDRRDAPVGAAPLDLARALARSKAQVILLDWSLDGIGLSAQLGLAPRRGLADVLTGTCTFEDVIAPLPGSSAHVISAGSALARPSTALDRDRINMLLDALDEAYDHVVITGGWPALKELFKTIEGCIDAGVVVSTPGSDAISGDFLGFQVGDLDVIRYEPKGDQDHLAQRLGAGVPGTSASAST